ncbi:FimB/Mfa2 family fimbrial subunit [Parabacteroides sp. OttesenSCG-928-J18]|nr:FimB/Mfa2 family fimbrial subunit [Parabacteroides sp. OttesenSCG-928-J18]
MKRLRHLSLLLCGALVLLSSCVEDDLAPCTNYLNITYDYNMEFVDQFPVQVSFLSIFMFDAETGLLVREVKEAQNPFPANYRIEIPEAWFGKRYNLMAWAGLKADSYDFPTLTPGVSTLADFQLKVKEYESQLVDRRSALEPLWHGSLTDVSFAWSGEEIHTLSLRKDTRKFRLVVQCMDDNEIVTSSDLDVRILSSGGWYDNANQVLDPKERAITYLPYFTQDDPEVGMIAELNTMRLLNDGRANRLVVTDKKNGKSLLDISLMKYLNALRLLEFENMPFQEYLDREDEYHILIFVQRVKDPVRPEEGNWLAVQVMINDWVIRFQDINIDPDP